MNKAHLEVAAVRAWYDRTAVGFSSRYLGNSGEFWERFEEKVALDWLPDAAERILDLGCGSGRLTDSLSSRATKVLGVDISIAMLSVAQSRRPSENVRYSVMDATETALEADSFDAIISLGLFEYLDDPSPFLNEIRRVLKPGGRVIFTCHNRAPVAMRAWMFARGSIKSLARRSEPSRTGMFRTTEHDAGKMLQLLRARGFVGPDFRGFHFPLSVDAFRISALIPARALSTAGKSAAVMLDAWIGRSMLTRSLCPLAMFTACKPS